MDENSLIDEPELAVQLEPVELSTEQLQEKIRTLSTTSDGEDLKFAMRDLKRALLANPSACALLLPEDIGEAVQALKRMIGPSLEKEETKRTKKEAKATKAAETKILKPSDFSMEDLKGLSDDDFI